MKTVTRLCLTLLTILVCVGTSRAIDGSYSLSTANCTVTANSFAFDMMATNTGTADLHINNVTVRFTHGTGLLPSGTNNMTMTFVNDGQSVVPLLFPPNAASNAS